MAVLPFPERLDRVEDEVAALESMVDARTRTLWQAIQKIQAELAEVKEQLKQGAMQRREK